MTELYVDADACPVKDEILKVARRHGLTVHMVGNTWLRAGGDDPLLNRVVVGQGADAADDWIAERVGPGDVAVTQDIPLASRCLKAGAKALGPTGRPFTEDGIGMALGMRELNQHLREIGESKGGGPGFTKKDRSAFLQALETAVQAANKAGKAKGSSP